MKKMTSKQILQFLFLAAGGLLNGFRAGAQQPLTWSYSAKALGGGVYAVHLVAHLNQGYHLYSQQQPDGAIAEPLKVNYFSNPLIQLEGPTREIGKKITYSNPSLGIQQYQYEGQLDLVQNVKLKDEVKATITGTIHFQVCTDEQCYPPADLRFAVAIGAGGPGK